MNRSRFIALLPSLICVLFMIMLYGVTFRHVFPKHFRNLGYSKYFVQDETEKKLLQYDGDKVRNAFDYFRTLNKTKEKFEFNNISPSISIVIPTTKRGHYIIRVVARIMHEYYRDKPNIMEIIVVNNNKPLEVHTDAIYLSRYMRVVNNSDNMHIENFLHKQCKDMMTSLNEGINTMADYILVLEDDALPIKGFFKRLENILTKHLTQYNISNVALMKLYYPDKWYGYEMDEIMELLCIAFSCSTFITVLLCLVLKKCKYLRTRGVNVNLFIIYISLFVYFVLVIYSFGRVHWIELLRRHCPLLCQRLLPAPRCCTPAVLYTRHFALTLTRHIRCTFEHPYDFALDDTVKRFHFKQFLVFPNMFLHIGFQSSSPSKRNEASEFMFLLDN